MSSKVRKKIKGYRERGHKTWGNYINILRTGDKKSNRGKRWKGRKKERKKPLR